MELATALSLIIGTASLVISGFLAILRWYERRVDPVWWIDWSLSNGFGESSIRICNVGFRPFTVLFVECVAKEELTEDPPTLRLINTVDRNEHFFLTPGQSVQFVLPGDQDSIYFSLFGREFEMVLAHRPSKRYRLVAPHHSPEVTTFTNRLAIEIAKLEMLQVAYEPGTDSLRVHGKGKQRAISLVPGMALIKPSDLIGSQTVSLSGASPRFDSSIVDREVQDLSRLLADHFPKVFQVTARGVVWHPDVRRAFLRGEVPRIR